MKLKELKKAYSPVPQTFRERVEAAIEEGKRKEGSAPRRRIRVGALLAAAILSALLLIGGITAGAVFSGKNENAEEGVRVNISAADPQKIAEAERHGSVRSDDGEALLVEVEGAALSAPEFAKLCVTLPEGYAPMNALKFRRTDQANGGISVLLRRLDRAVPVQALYGPGSQAEEESVNGRRVIRVGVNGRFDRIYLLIFEEQNLALQLWAYESVTEEEIRFFLERVSVVPMEKETWEAERERYLVKYADLPEGAEQRNLAKSVGVEWEENGWKIREGGSIYGDQEIRAPKGTVAGVTEYFVEIELYDAGRI